MFKKLLANITITAMLALLIPSLASAISYAEPEQLLPDNMDIVVNVNLNNSQIIKDFVTSFGESINDEVFNLILAKVLKNKVIIGLRDIDPHMGVGDLFMATRGTKTEFNQLLKAIESIDSMKKIDSTSEYYCSITGDGCIARFANYIYITTLESNMDEIAINYSKGERDVLKYTPNYISSKKSQLRNSVLNVFMDYDLVAELFENEFIYEDENLTNFLGQVIDSVEYESGSLDVQNKSIKGRFVLSHNTNKLRYLPYSYRDFLFKNSLHKYVDNDNLVFFSEASNLAKRIEVLLNILNNEEISKELKPVTDVLGALKGNFSFTINTPEETALPIITFTAETSKIKRKLVLQHLENLNTYLLEKIEESNNQNKEYYGEDYPEIILETLSTGLYKITFPLDEYSAKELKQDSFSIQYGINQFGLFTITNNTEAAKKTTMSNVAFKQFIKTKENNLGNMFLDFSELSNYVTKLNTSYEADIDTEVIDILNRLGIFTAAASYSNGNIQMDTVLKHNLEDYLEEFLQTIQEEALYY